MEFARSRKGGASLHARLALEKPRGVREGTAGNRRVPTRKWAKELDCRLIMELWAFEGNRIAVCFAYE